MTHPSSRNGSWWRRWLHGPRPRPAVRRRPRLEILEDRLTPTAQLVADVNLATLSSSPGNFLVIGTTFFFTTSDAVHGSELWRSDGTETGTVLVKDIRPGGFSSYLRYLTNVNGTLFFRANDGTSGYELWRSNGTDSGTLRVMDIRPGIGGGNPYSLTEVNGTLLFSANDGTRGAELWRSDGTDAGTALVKDIRPGSLSSSFGSFTNVNGTLLFSANDGTRGAELWRSDGTATGTVRVKDIHPGSLGSYPRYQADVNGTLFFVAYDGTSGLELWRSDGTATGTALVKDIRPGLANGLYLSQSPINVNGTLFFHANDGSSGSELWRSDGSATGTVRVKDILPGSEGGFLARYLTNFNGTLFFQAFDGSSGEELWRSDGTDSGTALVKDIFPGSFGSSPFALANVNGTLFFNASDGTGGSELWRSDGSATGTVRVKDILPGSNSSFAAGLTNFNGTLFFRANDGTSGTELWRSDGSATGTVRVKDINPISLNSYPAGMSNVNGTVFFRANDGTSGQELWRSDGSATGTARVKDIRPGSSDSNPGRVTNVNGTLFFSANGGSSGYELWRSDGTDTGTVLVKDIRPGFYGSSPRYLTNVNGTLFFTANDGTSGRELWRSDGSDTGTVRVQDIRPGNSNSYTDWLTNVTGTLFFIANDASSGYELWRSDGTDTGTSRVKDIWSGSFGSQPRNLRNVSGTLFFQAQDGSSGYELWRSDGTDTGTVRVKDILPGGSSSFNMPFSSQTNVNGTLFFRASDGSSGYELWRSDGTDSGTVRVKDINPGNGHSYPDRLTNVNGTLFFRASDGTSGTELWRSDGTDTGTVRVKDIFPGSLSGTSQNLTNVNGTLFFTANDGSSGLELWRSDGTSAGTFLVADIDPGAGSSSPGYLSEANGTLFFRANDTLHGVELWQYTPSFAVFPLSLPAGTYGTAYSQTVVAIGGTPAYTFAVTAGALPGGLMLSADGLLSGVPTESGSFTFTVTATDASEDGPFDTSRDYVLIIDKAPLTITGDNKAKVYGSANPALTASFIGLVNGDTAAVVTGLVLSTSATTGSGVGPYVISASGGMAANYTVMHVNGTLTVTPAPLTITAEDKSKVFGSANPSLTASFSGLVSGDTAAVVSGLVLATSATTGSNVGAYTITTSGGTAANYSITRVNATLTVMPAPLTITAVNKNRVYGQANPALTVTFIGLVNGNSSSVVSGLSVSTGATTASGAGDYPITLSGGTAANYTITRVNGTLTVMAAPLTITADSKIVVHGQANPPLTAAFTGLVNGDTPAVVIGLALSTSATMASDVGTYPITAAAGMAANYTITHIDGMLTVIPTAAVATGHDTGTGTVQIYDAATGQRLVTFDAYAAVVVGYTGGARVAMGDVNGDGITDVIVAPGKGMTPGAEVRVYDGAVLLAGLVPAGPLFRFHPYDTTYTGEVYVAASDFNGDNRADIVTGNVPVRGPRVKIFDAADLDDGDPVAELASFKPFGGLYKGGARLAVGNVNGTGKPDVIVGMSRNGSQMKAFDGDQLLLGKLKVLVNKVVSPVLVIKGGVFVAGGNIDGDARIDIIVGLGAGAKSNVFVFEDASDANAKAAQRKKSAPNYAAYKGGVRVAAVDVTGDGKVEVLTTAGAGLNPYRLRVLDGLALTLLDTLFAQAPDLTESRFLAGSP